MKKKLKLIAVVIMIALINSIVYFNRNINKNIESVLAFKISEILIYSGASGENVSDNYQNPEWNLKIYQYSDIAIYLERLEGFADFNNIKSIYINNVDLGSPRLGNSKLYYLNPLDYGTDKIIESNEINEELEFEVLNSENKSNDISYSIPIFFQDLSVPITLKYVNLDLANSLKISNSNKLTLNGGLLKIAQINPKDIENRISFVINIKTGDDRIITQKIEFDIPLKDNNNNSLYEGNVEYVEEVNLSF